MSKTIVRCAAACLTVAVLAFAGSGCWNPFAPDPGDGNPDVDVTYKERTSPDNVVYNLYTAYKDMNAQKYLECLAEEFEFHLNPDDYEDPENELPEYWGKQDERDIHEAMFAEDSNVERITLTLTNSTKVFSQGENPSDPMDDTWTYRELTDLRVTVPNDLTYLANADQEFVFRIDPNETGPEGETLWEIIFWYDLQESPYRKPIVEDTGDRVSFGHLKAMYRQ
ncbi:MAG: hypothetical protein ABIG03_04350 [Candidatus Eisenbacteria bacterium]